MVQNMNFLEWFILLFLIFGIADGFRKGFAKKAASLAATLVTLLAVYLLSPYVAEVLEQFLPGIFSVEDLVGHENEIYKILVLSGLSESVEEYVVIFAARVLSFILTFIVIRLFIRTVLFSAQILSKVPGVSFLNRTAGAFLGFVQQMITVWIFFLFVAIFSQSQWGSILLTCIEQSRWLSYFYNNNLLLLIGILLVLK